MHRCSRGRPKCSLLVHSRDVISLMKPAFVWLGFRGPDCNVIAEQGGGPDTRPSLAGSGPRAGGCPTLLYVNMGQIIGNMNFAKKNTLPNFLGGILLVCYKGYLTRPNPVEKASVAICSVNGRFLT